MEGYKYIIFISSIIYICDIYAIIGSTMLVDLFTCNSMYTLILPRGDVIIVFINDNITIIELNWIELNWIELNKEVKTDFRFLIHEQHNISYLLSHSMTLIVLEGVEAAAALPL